MEYSNFDAIIEEVQSFKSAKRVVLVGSEEEHALEAVFYAEERGIVTPVLVGNREKTLKILKKLGYKDKSYVMADKSYVMADVADHAEYAKTAVNLIKDGQGDILMKGLIETKDFLKPVVSSQSGLTDGQLISHFSLAELPNYPKLIALADAAVVMYPTLEEKKQIIINSVNALKRIGYACPKVAVLCAIEAVNPKLFETVDAAELVKQWENGEIPDCNLAGPLSYDLALSRESAGTKNVACPWCGDFDLLIVPQMSTGNMLIKSWHFTAGAKLAGIIVGAKVPIVLASRSASTEGKFLSLVLSAACR